MKRVILFVISSFCLFSCLSPLKGLNTSEVPAYAKERLEKIRFDSAFNIISKPVSMSTKEGATLNFRYAAQLQNDYLVGNLKKDSSYVGIESLNKSIKIKFKLIDMCCDCGHNPRHCATSKQGMIDATAKYHCSGWSALVLSQ